jgi:PAS domain S-box-containing protein
VSPDSVRPHELQSLWQLTFQDTRFGISIVDAETRILRLVNPAFAAMHGGEPEDFVGKPLQSVFTEESAATIPGLSREVRDGHISYEADHVRLDGSVFPVAAEVMTARNASTGAIQRVAWYTDLTERRRVEQERDEALRRFEAAFEHAPLGIALLDLDDRWVAINRALCEIIGYSEEELRELSFAQISHPDDADGDLEQYRQLLRGDLDTYTIEKRYLHKDGGPIWALASVSLVRGEETEPRHLIVQIQDITARKRMEEDLVHAARGFQLAQDLLCTATFDGRLDRINGTWTEILGWTNDDLRAHGFLHFVVEEDRERTVAEVSKFAGGGSSRGFRNRWKTKDGGWVWLEWSAVGIPEEGRVFCVGRDVSEAVILEQGLELQAEIAANMADGVCLIRVADGEIVYTNPRFEQMMGYEENELIGRLTDEVMLPPQDAVEGVSVAELQQRIDEQGSATYEARRRRKDGRLIWCRATASRLDHAEYGEIWILVQHEITDERRARELRAELERSKDRFFSSVTHELRTPLTSILGYTEILRQDAVDLGAEGAEAIEIIERNANRELRLVEDLLSIATSHGTEFGVERQPLDLSAIVEDAVAGARPAGEENGLELLTNLDGPVPVQGDPDRLAQVVSNLLSNAIKFTPTGGTITVGLCAVAGQALLSVTDSGPGIADEERPRIFERFYRGEQARQGQVPGAGLGLAIARAIAEAHGGSIRLRDEGAPGTTFEVALPAGGAASASAG